MVQGPWARLHAHGDGYFRGLPAARSRRGEIPLCNRGERRQYAPGWPLFDFSTISAASARTVFIAFCVIDADISYSLQEGVFCLKLHAHTRKEMASSAAASAASALSLLLRASSKDVVAKFFNACYRHRDSPGEVHWLGAADSSCARERRKADVKSNVLYPPGVSWGLMQIATSRHVLALGLSPEEAAQVGLPRAGSLQERSCNE